MIDLCLFHEVVAEGVQVFHVNEISSSEWKVQFHWKHN